jgi:sugar transferase EpsL
LLKRFLDLTLSTVTLLVSSPVLMTVALLVRFLLGRPVLFRQERPGLNGMPFRLYKFRTMTDARDAAGELLPDGLRLAPLGKWLRKLSLDELPQLINVIKGDLSLVGPRPLLMDYLPLYNAHQARRHDVKPGITGWAQVNGRNALTWEEKLNLDVWYVDHQSLWLDLRILWMTVAKVIRGEGISQEGQATMERFMGTKSPDDDHLAENQKGS